MKMINTEAWILHMGPERPEPAILMKEDFSFPDITENEVLVEPIYGCWEGNMAHAVDRAPVDICRQRREDKIVIGNSGVVRILRAGTSVKHLNAGDLGLFYPVGSTGPNGYMLKVAGYDAPGSFGLLAKQMKLCPDQILPLPVQTRYSLRQWAAFGLRYLTAWSNWRVAYGAWRLQISREEVPDEQTFVWGWGGGVVLAELALAKSRGCQVFMLSSQDNRLKLIQDMGITPVDRRLFSALDFDEEKYRVDVAYKQRYQEAEKAFLAVVREYTSGRGVSIFIDNIGSPVFRATIKALGYQGVVTTTGWKKGMNLQFLRAIECINRHVYVHTHGARYSECVAAITFAEETGWIPPDTTEVYGWEDIPQLARDYSAGTTTSYFPLFQVNTHGSASESDAKHERRLTLVR